MSSFLDTSNPSSTSWAKFRRLRFSSDADNVRLTNACIIIIINIIIIMQKQRLRRLLIRCSLCWGRRPHSPAAELWTGVETEKLLFLSCPGWWLWCVFHNYYAVLLPGRGRILRCTLSVCPSVPLSLPSVTSRHLANYNDTHVLFGTHWRHPNFSARTEGRISYTAISAAQILVIMAECAVILCNFNAIFVWLYNTFMTYWSWFDHTSSCRTQGEGVVLVLLTNN